MCLAQKVRLSGEPFAIAHCNFGLRGADSDADEQFVRAWAVDAGVVCHVMRFDTAAYAASEGISIEMSARRLRYHWFGELCREFGYSAVAVAHNANDNAETLILNLLRGTGLRGITGMQTSGFIPDPDFGDIPLLRPLLGLTRAEIETYAHEQGLAWREDATNAQNDYKRNKIRNLVFPVFREINPRFVEVLNRDMERFADEVPAPQDQVRQLFGPSPLSGAGLSPTSMAQSGLECSIVGPGPGGKIGPGPKKAWTWSKDDVDLVQEPWDGSQPLKQPVGVLILDADKLEPTVLEALLAHGAPHLQKAVFGQWESGDWIRPLGAPGKKKMQDWFTDHHIPTDEKPFVPLLKSAADPHHVLAVIPYCIDHSVRVTKTTRRIIRITAQEASNVND